MSCPLQRNGDDNNKKSFDEYATSDEDADIQPPKRKRKGRPKNYMMWGEPEEEEDVPWSTKKGLSSGPQSSQQGAGDADISSNYKSVRIESCKASSKNTLSAPWEQESEPGARNTEYEVHTDESSDLSIASTEKVTTASSESESDADNIINGFEDSSEDGYQEEPPQEEQFIPEYDSEDDLEPNEGIAASTPDTDHEHEARRTTSEENLSQNMPEELTAPVPMAHHAVNPAIPAYKSTLDKIMSPQYSERITATVCISPKEILLNLLNLNEAHSINRTLFVNICKLVNSMFSDSIIPDTSFKLDSLFFSTSGLVYHFYCKGCLKPLKNKQKTDLVTCKCGVVNNVADLDKAAYFVTFDICTQLEMILRDPEVAAKLININSYERLSSGMHDLYDGDVHRNFRITLDFRDGALHITVIICADGSPLFKSSNCDIWPFLASINELPFRERMKRAFLLGMWFGPPKPDFQTFFKPIVRSLRNLSLHGATINIGGKQTFVKVHCIGGCFDSGARGPIQGIHLHNGHYGCNWCLHPGETEGHGSSARKFRYLETPPALRTHQQVVNDAKAVEVLARSRCTSGPMPHVNGVLARSELLKLPDFDIVNGMVLDAMHNSFLGVTRQFLRLWCGLEGNLLLPDKSLPGYYIGSPSVMNKTNARIALLVVPIECRRLPRSLLELVHWKAHELENFLLYFLFIVLDGILKKKYLTHMTLYVQGMYLLMKEVVLPEDLATAEYLLDKFVREIEDLYKNPNFSEFKQYTYNVHLTIHAVQNARNWGNAWSSSGYGYESIIGDLHDIVAANKGIALQITRSLCKNNIRNLLSQDIKSASCASFVSGITPQKSASVAFVNNVKVTLAAATFRPTEEEEFLLRQSSFEVEEFCEGKKIFHNGCVFAPRIKDSSRTRNDFVMLTNGEFVQIKRIIISESLEAVLVFCSYVHVTPYLVPLPSHLTLTSPFLYYVDLIEQELHLLPHNLLSKICVHSDLRSLGGKETISVMANVMNVF